MINTHYQIPEFSDLERKATRDGFGEALVEVGRKSQQAVVLTADLAESTRAHLFQEKYPNRFIEVGVAEQNLMGVAAGMALSGKIPFVASYAVFSPGRSWDQLRVSVCYSQANVKVIGGHTGLSVGPDGATHQALEDIAITRCLPHLMVVCPCDYQQAKKATLAIAQHKGPVYMRTSREATPILTVPETSFELGKAQNFRTGSDVTVVACGSMVFEALVAAHVLAENGVSIEVLNLHTIKPIDSETLVASMAKTGAVVTAEEHQILGGMGSAVAEVAAQNFPVPIEMVGMLDQFGESGKPAELMAKYHLTSQDIITAVQKVLARKATYRR
jgi:transketolase